MATEMEKPRVTEIKVRMDCNGCVQKIKKALHGVNGISDIYVDVPEQKITVTGWAEPQKLVKAIKRTRRSAVVCIHTDQPEETAQTTEPPPEGETPPDEGVPPSPPEPTNPPPEATQTEEAAHEPTQPENPPPPTSQPHQPSTRIGGGVHIIDHHPHEYGYGYGYEYPYGPNLQQSYRGERYQPTQPSHNSYRPSPHVTEYEHPISPPRCSFYSRPDHYNNPAFQREPPGPPQPSYATHSYNTYKPSPYVTGYAYPHSLPTHSPYNGPGLRGESTQPPQPIYATHNYMYKPSPYVTEYGFHEPPPTYSSYSTPNNYSGNYENGNVTSIFSDENPNACRIV